MVEKKLKFGFKFGQVKVTVANDGVHPQPWGRGENVYRYAVHVNAYGVPYSTKAWGSIHDYQRGHHDHEGIAAMVVDELASAYTDPDGFFEMALEGVKGREAFERGKEINKIVETAQKMGGIIVSAADVVREKGLL